MAVFLVKGRLFLGRFGYKEAVRGDICLVKPFQKELKGSFWKG
jgi:hypothetical protein